MASFTMSSVAAPALSSKYSISRSKAALKSASRYPFQHLRWHLARKVQSRVRRSRDPRRDGSEPPARRSVPFEAKLTEITLRRPVPSPRRASAAHRAALRAPIARGSLKVCATKLTEPVSLNIQPDDPTNYTVAILGDLHMDPRDVEHSYERREHVKKVLDESPNPFLVSLGDLGESKDCTESKQLFAGTTECFKMGREFLDGFGHKYDIVGGNHDLEGIDEFEGRAFHTSRWDYAYTGGSPDGDPMDKLKDKRVAIIGTGATAVQCVPHLAKAAKELLVFQRTPSSVDKRNNEPIDREWFDSIATPGWQKRWFENFVDNQSQGFPEEDYVMDGWTELSRRIREKVRQMPPDQWTPEGMLQAFEDADFEKMEEIRHRCEEVVADQDTAEKLKAWYRQLCKRPCFHDE